MEIDPKPAVECTGDLSLSSEDHGHTPWDEGRNDSGIAIPISQPPEAGVGDNVRKPVDIASNSGGLPEPIPDDQVGIVIEQDRNVEDVKAWVDRAASLSSVTTDEIDVELAEPYRTTGTNVNNFQARGGKYARVTGLFIEGLQARVAMLEESIHEIRTSAGSGKGPAMLEENRKEIQAMLEKSIHEILTSTGSGKGPHGTM